MESIFSIRQATNNRMHSDCQLRMCWLQLRSHWFMESIWLDDYRLVWSSRAQQRTLASCNIKATKVIVARELNYPQHGIWLKPLLYHEMCHAYLGRTTVGNRHSWHGKAFKLLERQHPLIPLFNQWVKAGGWEKAILHDKQVRAQKLAHEANTTTASG